jgi:hypothetical protein
MKILKCHRTHLIQIKKDINRTDLSEIKDEKI